jgi:hypothetical protein
MKAAELNFTPLSATPPCTGMDQINHSRYPSSPSPHSISTTLFYVGVVLFAGAPLNYMLVRNAEQTMILTAYSFFFFLGSGLVSLCSSQYDAD